jgi:hypothetical protein
MSRVLFFAIVLANVAAAAPAITGLYRAGELGIVDMQTIEGRIVARYRGGGTCNFKPEIQVLSGNFEGSVFLGTVFVCQEGPSCEKEKTFPFLAVYHDGALAGDVKLDVGCNSPGLEGKRLNVSVATAEDRFVIQREAGGESSASAIAAKNQNKKDNEKRGFEAYQEAQIKLSENNFVAARSALERSITYDDTEWKPWMYLGVVEMQLNNVAKGLDSLQKAVKLASGAKHVTDEEAGELFYYVACANTRSGKKREAISSLRQAFKVGDVGKLLKNVEVEHDLDPVRDEPDFRRVIADAKANKDKHHR